MTDFQRLPDNVQPINYRLTIKPDLEKLTFQGQVDIELVRTDKPGHDPKLIVLNSIELDLLTAQYVDIGRTQSLKPRVIDLFELEERAYLRFDSTLPNGPGVLSLTFNGILNDKLRGLYRMKYQDRNGQDRWAATTQFAATEARRVFPCFDEPAIKATFELALIVNRDLVALSNMPQISDTPSADGVHRIVKFDRTPQMSTYLLAMAIGEFDFVEGRTTDHRTLCRVYTPRGKAETGQFALDVTSRALPYYADYFSIPYKLPKCDLITVEMSYGAMENWGLITYRESRLLVDPGNTSLSTKQDVALVVAHELAHQWFGNLVTMEWWSDLWLNEGYASFIEYLCVDKLFPEYQIWTQFVTDNLTRALELDALDNSHPILVKVGNPGEINEIFDAISYSKGASIIRMLHNWLGDDLFRKGMSSYLNKHAFSNATTDDLWSALQEASAKPVHELMSRWTQQKGFPVLDVQLNNGNELRIRQQKFSANGNVAPEDQSLLWMVPVSLVTSTGQRLDLLMDQSEYIAKLEGPIEYVKLNLDCVGVYRVSYSDELLEGLVKAIGEGKIAAIDRLGIQSDLFALVRAGKASTVKFLQLLEAYRNETDFNVWSSIIESLKKIDTLLSHTDDQQQFHIYARNLLAGIYSKVGWTSRPSDTHMDILLRPLIISALIKFDDPEVLDKARQQFTDYTNGRAIIDPDLRGPVYKAVAKSGPLDQLFDLFRKSDLKEEKDRISRSMGAANDPDQITRVLQWAISEEIQAQDCPFIIANTALSRQGRQQSWEFFKANWQFFKDRYENGILASRLVKWVTENFATEQMAQEVSEFFGKNPIPGSERSVQQSLESIRVQSDWLNRDGQSIKDYLSRVNA